MKYLKYLFQFCFAIFSFAIFKILGANLSSKISGKIFEKIGPYFRSRKIIYSNINIAFQNIDSKDIKKINQSMWNNYGRVFAEYMFIKNFRLGNLSTNIEIQGQHILDEIIDSKKQVVFISGHLANFELMAMYLEKTGINLSAIYRPLNNIFLNPLMENIRKKYICSKQIKKGISGTKEILKYFKSGASVALMIDQRVSEGIKSILFGNEAFTTTIPGQFVKKFNCKIVPIYIERKNNENFTLEIMEPMNFNNDESIENITLELNQLLEKMITRNPYQWIWSHNRWK